MPASGQIGRERADVVLTRTAAALSIALIAMWLVPATSFSSERWYSQKQIEAGEAVYRANCLSCHLEAGGGAENWWERDAEGKLPPPPLDGTAHTWHHDLGVLAKIVLDGGSRFGGNMPGFSTQLSAKEIVAVLAYIQSLWPDEVYEIWAESFPASASRGIPVPAD